MLMGCNSRIVGKCLFVIRRLQSYDGFYDCSAGTGTPGSATKKLKCFHRGISRIFG